MEILKPLTQTNPQIFSTSSLYYNTIKVHRSRNISSDLRRPSFRFPLKPSPSPLARNFPTHCSRNFRASAYFDKPTRRRKNSLRKKLIGQQVSRNPQINDDPSPNVEDPDFESGHIKDSVLMMCNLEVLDSGKVSKSRTVQNPVNEFDDNDEVIDRVDVSKSKSVLSNQLRSWVDQYKADAQFWGIGSSPIFTVFRDSDGKVEKVDVNENEILRRSQIESSLYTMQEVKDLDDIKEVHSRVSHARSLAREMEETGRCVLPANSSVAKLINSNEKLGFYDKIQGFVNSPGVVPKLSKVGISVFCVFFMFLALKSFFTGRTDKKEHSLLEKEMLRRKIKARIAKEKLVKGSVEVIQDSKEPEIVFKERPQLNNEELMDSIVKIKASNDGSVDLHSKIEEIRTMARHAREIERTDASSSDDANEEDSETVSNIPDEMEMIQIEPKSFDNPLGGFTREIERTDALAGNNSNEGDTETVRNIPNEMEVIQIEPKSFDDPQGGSNRIVSGMTSAETSNIGNSDASKLEVPKGDVCAMQVVENKHTNIIDTERVLGKNSLKAKPRIISSVQEAREYLSKKQHDKQEKIQEAEVATFQEVAMNPTSTSKSSGGSDGEVLISSVNGALSRSSSSKDTAQGLKRNILIQNDISEDDKEEHGQGLDAKGQELGRLNREKWVDDNFHEFEPIVEKFRAGFRDNYMVAREKAKENVNISELKLPEEDGSELEWMKDEKLREIVFQVRENELMARDPFYQMDAEDKALFFKGLEKKVEKVNEKLHGLHQHLHSNIENLDYGADGISLYDPPEKIIPRWKGPPPASATSPEFLDEYLQQRKALFAETLGNSNLVKGDPQVSLQNANPKDERGNLKSPKTIIEGSDGSVRPGKKSGKEFWQHTKKWSSEFLKSYNAENDPETKAVMKEIGKDLDRWITEKEIQDAAKILDNVPEKGKKVIREKLNKVKREMELFGPHAVLNKYSEYVEEKEVDYYWWLDLPLLLCIELYIDGDGEQRIGFYSLEMAADLELNPKPHHVIAFEDAGDCKNFCYIIQAHLEMLGNGNAFVVPQPPKDTYREAKANGFNVTVIRKGELKLNVDQTLEEVEEQIAEIGSKMYHDQITKGRNVSVDSLMKGVFGLERSTNRRRSKKKLKKPTK